MSYEILYGRQFVRLPDNKIIPVVLQGSNNCTQFIGNREVLERNWCCFAGIYNFTADELIKWAEVQAEKYPTSEFYKSGSRWITGANIVRWVKSGIASARTIEEIKARCGQTLHCYLSIWDGTLDYCDPMHHKNEMRKFCSTSEEIVEWLKDAEERCKNKTANETVYICTEFSGREPLGLGKKTGKVDGPVMCKVGGGYLVEFNNDSYAYSSHGDYSEALVFKSEEDFFEQVKDSSILRRETKFNLVSANREPKDFAIMVDGVAYGNTYVLKLTRSRLHFTCSKNSAMKFVSEKAAEKYIEKLKTRVSRTSMSFEVVNVKEPAIA